MSIFYKQCKYQAMHQCIKFISMLNTFLRHRIDLPISNYIHSKITCSFFSKTDFDPKYDWPQGKRTRVLEEQSTTRIVRRRLDLFVLGAYRADRQRAPLQDRISAAAEHGFDKLYGINTWKRTHHFKNNDRATGSHHTRTLGIISDCRERMHTRKYITKLIPVLDLIGLSFVPHTSL
jgi:hypothetical protein